MKSAKKSSSRRSGYQSDDENVRYKINTKAKSPSKSPSKHSSPKDKFKSSKDDVKYKLPTVVIKPLQEQPKSKHKPKIKVNFWSNKQSSRLRNTNYNQETNRRHTVGGSTAPNIKVMKVKPKTAVKVSKQVSFLPSPLFSDNHIPMVTVPDDLTIHLNEEEANDLNLNHAFINSNANYVEHDITKHSTTQTSPRGSKRKHSNDDIRNHGNDNELEFFSKYVVQKLRKMETNQRIYSENLINTVLMLGQLGKLNGKSKINEA